MSPAKFKLSLLLTLQGKTFLVTGGNTGIGYATTLILAAKGARVYISARSLTTANLAISKILALHPEGDLHTLILDHTSLSSVVSAAQKFSSNGKKLHGLIVNAGILAVPYEIEKDDFESQMQVKYLAHRLLTFHLLPTLLATARGEGLGRVRVVCVSSEGHQKSSFGTTRILYDEDEVKAFRDFGRYGLSKLANVMHAKSLHSQFGPGSESARAGRGLIWTGSLHPGFIDTGMNKSIRDLLGSHGI
ncbi:related to dehydrogenases with different specificities (related to short-chain alcohol dehydrogenases) [Rhynchosporium graminicola]|uniref:Related to dehydrogenases with different specificities (Related to short-chain alcohol dehydrogenases) n=1 Tax=Rhynchosporium graminicola TaxID=2792576 RepID=A0A1E1KTI6_9HELO|nr:related to dehydrogenases with different specificities (related to short-chain alcohol dehydrogenases) [Rhynchosporium commune]